MVASQPPATTLLAPNWLIAVVAAGLRVALGDLVIDPLTSYFWPPAVAPAGIDEVRGNLGAAAWWLLLVWTVAAFGEEFVYRGYLLGRAVEAGNNTKAAAWLAMVGVSVLFGFGHFYKGPAGIVDSGCAGLILGAAYLLAGRNLWVCILAHGFIDTLAVMLL